VIFLHCVITVSYDNNELSFIFIMLTVRLSVCHVLFSNLNRARRVLNVTHQAAARNAASVHFRPSITRTAIVVLP